MNQISVELVLLLGTESAEKCLEQMGQDQRLLEVRYSSKSQCVLHIKELLRGLMKVLDLGYLASVFNVSPGFLTLIKAKARKSGHCLKCDTHSKNLKSHFTVIHNLNESYYNSYKISFGHQSESFLPKIPQKCRLFTPFYEKASKILQLPKSTNKEKPRLDKKAKNSSSKVLNEGKINESKKVVDKKDEKKTEPNKKTLQNILAGLACEYREKIREKGFGELLEVQENNKDDGKIDDGDLCDGKKVNESEAKGVEGSGVKEVFNVESEGEIEIEEREIVSKCEICMVPVKEKDRKVHMNAHKLNEIVTCAVCFSSMRRKYLNRHNNKHHKSK